MRSEVWGECGASARASNSRRSGFGHQVLRYYGRGARCCRWTGTGEGSLLRCKSAWTTGSSPVVTRKEPTRKRVTREVPSEMGYGFCKSPTGSDLHGRIAGRLANRGARSARRTSSRPQARDRARAMRRWPGKVEREAAHADRRDHASLSASSAPLTPHTVAKWHATATFLRHPPGAGRLAACLPLSYASIEI
jgi:hypothetical protein